MKQVFYNPEKAKQEEEIKDKEVLENEKRVKYITALRENKNFKKYILEEIIRVEITANENISGELVNLVGADPETVKSLIVAKSGGLTSSKNIYNKIVNC